MSLWCARLVYVEVQAAPREERSVLEQVTLEGSGARLVSADVDRHPPGGTSPESHGRTVDDQREARYNLARRHAANVTCGER